MPAAETILRALAGELKHMKDVDEPTVRIISFTIKVDRDGKIRAMEHGTEHHREVT